jgi:hypothetical protein
MSSAWRFLPSFGLSKTHDRMVRQENQVAKGRAPLQGCFWTGFPCTLRSIQTEASSLPTGQGSWHTVACWETLGSASLQWDVGKGDPKMVYTEVTYWPQHSVDLGVCQGALYFVLYIGITTPYIVKLVQLCLNFTAQTSCLPTSTFPGTMNRRLVLVVVAGQVRLLHEGLSGRV